MLGKIIATGAIFMGLAGIVGAQEAGQPNIEKKIEMSVQGPADCGDNKKVVMFDTTNNGKL